MPEYVDGYVLPIPKKKIAAYRRLARIGARAWKKHGALDYHECVAEDLQTEFGATFQRALKLKRGETVVFAWITFKSRAHRDRVNALVQQDPLMSSMGDMASMPFNPKRILYAGFQEIVRA